MSNLSFSITSFTETDIYFSLNRVLLLLYQIVAGSFLFLQDLQYLFKVALKMI